MTVHKHKMIAECPRCGMRVTMTGVSFDATGGIELDAECKICNIKLTVESDIRRVLTSCIETDVLVPLECQLKE